MIPPRPVCSLFSAAPLNRILISANNSGNIPASLLSTLLSLSTSSNEFLRQFWSAVLPPKVGDLSAAALATSEMKAAKAERMKVCLEKAMERIEGVLGDVRGTGDEGLLARVIGVSLFCVREILEGQLMYFKSFHVG